MSRTLSACLLALLVAVSCTGPVQNGRETIPLVNSIAGNAGSPEHIMLSSFAKIPSSGSIFVAGSPQLCSLIGDSFQDCDDFDNVRARLFSDGLKDFSGETVALAYDEAFAPYGDYVTSEGSDAMREVTVRTALAALREKCNISIYDIEGNKSKTPAKIIILADPWMLLRGKFDVDTLFSLTSCKVPVVSPLELLMESAFAGEKKYFNIGLMCDSLYIGTGVYKSVFEEKVAEHSIMGTGYFEAATSGSEGHILAEFLDKYMASGNPAPLDVLLVDDWSVNKQALMAELSDIRDFKKEESMRYGKMISPGFTIFCSSELTMHECYLTMRKLSLFTHRIALPELKFYTIKPLPGGKTQEFLLIPSENV